MRKWIYLDTDLLFHTSLANKAAINKINKQMTHFIVPYIIYSIKKHNIVNCFEYNLNSEVLFCGTRQACVLTADCSP